MSTKESTGEFKLTTSEITKVTTDAEGSPQNQEQGASANENLEIAPLSKADTTTSGGNSDDPIKLGDGIKYQDLTDRISNLETTVADMKDQLKQLVDAFKIQTSHQQLCQELRNSVQPILAAPRELAEIQLNSHMKLIRVMVEARYKDTQADIKGIKECIAKLTGTTPAPVFEKDDEDDA